MASCFHLFCTFIFSSVFVKVSSQNITKIVGGTDTFIAQYPYQLALFYNNRFICGASILSRKYGISAAHCFPTISPFYYKVRAGSSNYSLGGVVIPLKSIKKHPLFNKRNLNNDVAVFELSKSLFYSQYIQKISLASRLPPTGAKLIATGWGMTSSVLGYVPYQLQMVELPMENTFLCRINYLLRRIWLTNTQFCAGNVFSYGKGICFGDSGGPLAFNNQLVGISSAVGGFCAGIFSPSIFANVPTLSNFIYTNVIFD